MHRWTLHTEIIVIFNIQTYIHTYVYPNSIHSQHILTLHTRSQQRENRVFRNVRMKIDS